MPPSAPSQDQSSRRSSLISKVLQSAEALGLASNGKTSTPSGPRKRKLNTSSSLKSKKAKANGIPSTAKPLSAERSKEIDSSFAQHDVTTVYQIIHKQTGALGGNGAGGAIYGEITKKSMGNIIDFMVENCELNENSVFLDIGSGLGKPNFHAAVTPGVAISYGVELEDQRWELSLYNLQSVLTSTIRSKVRPVIFTQGDINNAQTLDPFSHVYSFDVGFPPAVMAHIAECFNKSKESKHFVSFHGPRKVVDQYGFKVEEIGRLTTSMAGSSEGHAVYFYRKCSKPRAKESKPDEEIEIDPMFRAGFHVVQQGHDKVVEWMEGHIAQRHSFGRTRRQLQMAKSTLSAVPQVKTLDQYYRRVHKAVVQTAK
ncbi:hypothetical protein LEN26_006474 [Aphanomyces euteiches]|nr:hypothetical protein AeMF1_010296 [Aphanomyces euteiches]KAH9135309.1 hypothetical protein LEN26_006474 [Aphanomyces euteiches]KAH9190860.1 hypothetical protein AeNC1_007174 [Aphanomyces euteiches]